MPDTTAEDGPQAFLPPGASPDALAALVANNRRLLGLPPQATSRPICEHEHACECDCGVPINCAQRARFSVRRGDAEPGYIPFDACEGHLADAVSMMADGSDIPMVVRIYWDGIDAS